MMSAHFCAAIPNFRIMEIDIDDVPWKDEVVSPPIIQAGHLIMSDQPGWGVEVNEEAIRAHPPKG
jgi:L-alanine-DL-glutamate epimerase-like enolase superfamily enzyme